MGTTPQFINGQLHNQPHRKGRSAPDGFGRLDGAPKRLADPHALTYGADKRVTKPSHQWAHGAPVQDEPMQKNFVGKGNVKTHPGMTTTPKRDDPYRGLHDPQSGNAVLADAPRGWVGRRDNANEGPHSFVHAA